MIKNKKATMKKICKRNKQERLKVVLEICKKLKTFPTSTGSTLDLYNSYYDAIHEVKQVFNEYINQDESNLVTFSGKVDFPEMGRTIEYILPIKEGINSTFVFRKQ